MCQEEEDTALGKVQAEENEEKDENHEPDSDSESSSFVFGFASKGKTEKSKDKESGTGPKGKKREAGEKVEKPPKGKGAKKQKADEISAKIEKGKSYHGFFYNLCDQPLQIYQNTVKERDIDSKMAKGMASVTELQELNDPTATATANSLQEIMDWTSQWVDLCKALRDRISKIGSRETTECLGFSGHQMRRFSLLSHDVWMTIFTDFGRRLSEARQRLMVCLYCYLNHFYVVIKIVVVGCRVCRACKYTCVTMRSASGLLQCRERQVFLEIPQP